MKLPSVLPTLGLLLLLGLSPTAPAEILAMLNYESRPDESLKELKLPFGKQLRREGIAVMDLDPQSDGYGQILMDIPLPPDLVAHHIFYNRDATKAYITALGRSEIRVMDLTRFPYRMQTIEVPQCTVIEDVVFSEDNRSWYATCMGSSNLMHGDAVADTLTGAIDLPAPYPHGIAIHTGIDRILVTSTVRASDLKDAGDRITAIAISTGKVTGQYRVSSKPAPGRDAPVEVLFVPHSSPPVAYITNMYGGTLWTARWRPQHQDFEVQQVFDFADKASAVPLEIYFTEAGKKLYVTTAKPGHLHFFDLDGDPAQPRWRKSLPTGEGAHHVGFTRDGRYAFVQNSLLNLPGMSDGTLTVVDLEKEQVIDTLTHFKERGFNPNCIVLLPEWNDPAGH